MKYLQRHSILILQILAFVLPLWLTIGRSFFGSGGWMTLIYIFTVAPFLFVFLFILSVLLIKRYDVRLTKLVSPADVVLLLGVYVSTFLHGFFLVDGGDTQESVNSVASKYFGFSHDISQVLSNTFFALAAILLLACVILFTAELIRNRTPGPQVKSI